MTTRQLKRLVAILRDHYRVRGVDSPDTNVTIGELAFAIERLAAEESAREQHEREEETQRIEEAAIREHEELSERYRFPPRPVIPRRPALFTGRLRLTDLVLQKLGLKP